MTKNPVSMLSHLNCLDLSVLDHPCNDKMVVWMLLCWDPVWAMSHIPVHDIYDLLVFNWDA